MSRPFTSKELECILNQMSKSGNYTGVEFCNRVFGFNNWSSEIKELRLYYTVEETSSDGKVTYSSGASAICRIVLRDDSHRDAVGTGDSSKCVSKMKSIQIAQQSAVTDAMQQCVKQFQVGILSTDDNELLPQAEYENESVCDHNSATSLSNVTGQKRNNQQCQSTNRTSTYASTPFTTPFNVTAPKPKSTKTTEIQSSSPTLEEIDLLMHQYEQVDNDITPPSTNNDRDIAGNISSASSPNRTASSYSSLDNNRINDVTFPTHPNLRGQKYPPNPNLQNPFQSNK